LKLIHSGNIQFRLEDEIVDMSFFKIPDDTIRARLIVAKNEVTLDTISITDAKLNNDTLKISLTKITGYSTSIQYT
jgi:riboflavin synthase alpha subunit